MLGFAVAGAGLPHGTAGTLDATFGSGGIVITRLDVASWGNSLAIQGDGKLVVGGHVVGLTGHRDIAVFRYLTDGTLDPTFGDGGVAAVDVGYDDRAKDVVIQRDGKIVAGGSVSDRHNLDFALVRFDSNGILDPTYGTGGIVTTDFGGLEMIRGLALQRDDKLVAAGYTTTVDGTDFAIARYNLDGSLDDTFGVGGKVTTSFGQSDVARDIAIQADQRIVVAGYTGDSPGENGRSKFAIARYNVDGSLDPTFGVNGRVTTPFDEFAQARSVALQASGKIVVVGYTGALVDPNLDFAIARYTSSGLLDRSFNRTGKVTTDLGAQDRCRAIAIQADGKIVVVGETSLDIGESDADFATVRYEPDGRLDPTFGSGGIVMTDLGSSDGARDVAIQPDGKIVEAGKSGGTEFGGSNAALVRYLGA